MILLAIGGCPQPPVDKRPDFTEQLKSILQSTSNTTEPVDIDDLDFRPEEDPTAFDDVLSGALPIPVPPEPALQ